MKLTMQHSGPLNMRAAHMLNGVHPGRKQTGKQILAALFRSDEPIDRQTRDAVADALERERGLRLELVLDKGWQTRNRAMTDELALLYEYQTIAEEVAARAAEIAVEKGLAPSRCMKPAKVDVAAARNISADKVKDALAASRSLKGAKIERG